MLNITEAQIWSDFIHKSLQAESSWVQVTFVVAMMLVFVFGVIGNLLTCIVIYCDRTMHTATNYYLFNLAVSDFIVTFAILLEILDYLSDSYQFGQVFCKIHFTLVVLLWNSSILTMTALAIERYIAIWYPLALKSTPVWRRVVKIIVVIWLVAILESLPEIFTVELVKTKKSSVCFTVPTPLARILNGILGLSGFVAPLAIMMFVYGMIAFKVNRMERRTADNQVFNHRDHTSRRVNKLVSLTVSFIVCWLPFFALRIIFFLNNVKILMSKPEWWCIGYKVMVFNSWFGVVLNPVLFSLMSTKFRNALKSLWRKKVKRRPSGQYTSYVETVRPTTI